MSTTATDLVHDLRRGALHSAAAAARRYVLLSHDGYGLGHTRRNAAIAMALLDDPGAHVVMLTGVTSSLKWLRHERLTVCRMPTLVKDATGTYGNPTMGFDAAIDRRRAMALAAVQVVDPQVVLIDRHPYGIGGELRPAVEHARERGARVVLGLRDILDEPDVIRAETGGAGWRDVADLFDEALVYGAPALCDHAAEYELPVEPVYVGWVAERAPMAARDHELVVVTGGGGGDAARLNRLVLTTADRGVRNVHRRPLHYLVVTGPLADASAFASTAVPSTVELVASLDGCAEAYARAGAVVQMAGYNSTFESLGAGIRPILLPRRAPRREQAIRASRLAALGVADIIDDDTTPSELAWLLQQDRVLPAAALARAGIDLDGARRTVARIGVRAARR